MLAAAAAAGRRTESAFPRFVAAYGFDADVYAARPLPNLVKLPDVTSAAELFGPFNGQPECRCTHPISPTNFSVIVASPEARSVFKLISGHLPDPSDPYQVLASFSLQQDYGVHLGTVIDVPFYSRSQASAINNATGAPPKPDGPTVAFHVVGFEATEYEFPSGTSPSYDLYATQAFVRTVIPRMAVDYVYAVRLRHGAADLPRFENEANALRAAGEGGVGNDDQQAASVEASIHPQAIGWWILAVLAALVGLAVIGQAVARQSVVEREDYPTMATLGLDRRQLVMLGMARNLVVGLAGAAGAVALATALSPIAPLGEARIAETSTGVAFDTLLLPLGALATVAVVLTLGIWPAIRAARILRFNDRKGASRASVVVAQLAAMGAPPSAVIGVQNALQRRSGGAAVPVASAFLGTVLAVMALCGTGVFGASLSHLTSTPELYGDPFRINFTAVAGTQTALLASLERDRAVTAITRGYATEVFVNKVAVGAIAVTAIRGRLLLSIADGHLPSGEGQIGLGATTMRQVDAHLGLVSFVPGPRGQAAITRYLDSYQSIAALPITPTSLINFGEAVNFPLIFGAMLALFGAATLVHLLVVSVSRRRREVGLLKVLGFVNRQIASSVAWQGTTLAVVGIVIGVPLGIVTGGAVWRTFAANLGAVPVSVVPIWLVVGLAAGVIVAANLLAIAPALTAARTKPGQLLRTT